MEEIKKEILKKYLKGKASEFEIQLVERWYENLSKNNKSSLTESDIEITQSRIFENVKRSMNFRSNNFRIYRLGAAAAITLFIAVSAVFIFFQSQNTMQYISAENIRARVELPDGSEIILNENSSITYPKKFSGGIRKIQLKGEAFFKIYRDTTKPFIVSVNDLDIRVLGTMFNVNAKNKHNEIKVTVEEGSVAILQKDVDFVSPKTAIAVLGAEEQLVYRGAMEFTEKFKLEKNLLDTELQWRDEKLIFRGSSLYEITETLEAWYNVEFKFLNPTLKGCTYTANFDSSLPLRNILELLKGAQDFDYNIDDRIIFINGLSCNN